MILHWSYILVIPGILLGFWAQAKVKGAFAKYSKVPSYRGVTAAQAARSILDASGLSNVSIERVAGNLTDHYDPRSKVLRLSESVVNSTSIAAIGIAAHEAGHAVQDAQGYAPFQWRSSLVPIASLGSQLFFPLILVGMFIPFLGKIGVILFMGVVLFQLVTLPVEFNASSRALQLVTDNGLLVQEEVTGAKKVLSAAALTYLASFLVSVLYLIQALIISDD